MTIKVLRRDADFENDYKKGYAWEVAKDCPEPPCGWVTTDGAKAWQPRKVQVPKG